MQNSTSSRPSSSTLRAQTAAVRAPADSVPGDGAADSRFQTGEALCAEGNFEGAIRLLSEARGDSGVAKYQYILGTCYEGMNDLASAKDRFARAVAIDTENNGYRFRYAMLLEQLDESNAAESEYAKIVNHDSSFVPASYRLGLLLYRTKKYDACQTALRRVLNANRRDFLSYYYTGCCFIAQGKDSAARSYISTAVTLNPTYLPALNALGSLEYEAKNFPQAEWIYRKALQSHPEVAELYYRLALCYEQEKKNDEAKDALVDAVRLEPSSDVYAGRLGYVYLWRQQYDSAVIMYQRASAIDSLNPNYYASLGYAYAELDLNARSVEFYHKAIRYSRPEAIGLIVTGLGGVLYREHHLEEALAAYNTALDYDPANVEAQFYSAVVNDDLLHTRSAIDEYKKFLKSASCDLAESTRVRETTERLRYLEGRSH
jgi:tetratricopeptide (TPR) repeat protein